MNNNSLIEIEKSQFYSHLKDVIEIKTAKIGVIGLGYVGLPTYVRLLKLGYSVYGLDRDENKINSLLNRESYVKDVSNNELEQLRDAIYVGTDTNVLSQLDIVVICVPTPLNQAGKPDITYIEDVIDIIGQNVHPGMLIILESSSYPGTTRKLIAEYFIIKGYSLGEDIFVAFSPERIDPGNTEYQIDTIPKLVGGITPKCTSLTSSFYTNSGYTVHETSSPEVAELSKLIENSYRAINIALINEIALVARNQHIDIIESINAAATKPFGYMPFYPGPGVGGHCIPVDPWYLVWWAESVGKNLSILKRSLAFNDNFHVNIISTIIDITGLLGCTVKDLKVLIIGVGYKKNIADFRDSPALKIMKQLKVMSVHFDYHDPYIDILSINEESYYTVNIDETIINSWDVIILVTDHDTIDYNMFSSCRSYIIDTRHRLKPSGNVIHLGSF
jgi:UDP-N-acetyl-D-glucosamine dehydrogenase